MKFKKIQINNATFEDIKPHIGDKYPKDLFDIFNDIDNGNLFFPYKEGGFGEVRLNWSMRRNKNKDVRITIIA